LVASVDTLGQQTPVSLAASAKAMRTSFGVGESFCRQAQFIAAMLTASPAPPVSSDARDDGASDPASLDQRPR